MEEKKANNAANGKLSWPVRLSYAGCDVACNVVFGMVGTLLTLFYTDYVGVAAATVGLIMLISRFFDGFSDMIMGIIVEKTNSKWGKSRPWILWMSVPYALSAILLFTVQMCIRDRTYSSRDTEYSGKTEIILWNTGKTFVEKQRGRYRGNHLPACEQKRG